MADIRDPVSHPARPWGSTTKRGVVWFLLVVFALLVYQFRAVIPQLVIAGALAFILEPAVRFLQRRLRMARTGATAVVFVVVVLAGLGVLAAPVTAVPAVQRAVRSVQLDFNRIVAEIGSFLGRPLQIGDYTIDLSAFYGQLSSMLSRFATSVAEGTLDIVLGIASGAVQLVFILIAAFYLLKDTHRLVESVDRLAPPGYRDDFIRLRRQITDAWSAFLRGQLLLGVVIAVITTIICTAVGLPYPVVLGLLAGLLEVVPHIGPILAAVPSVLLALFVGSSYLPLSPFWTAVLVAGLYILMQQVENNFLVPRIMARSLDLHPLTVLIALLIGGNVAGVVGIVLAPPVLATLRVIGRYVFYRLYDRDPFAEPSLTVATDGAARARRGLMAWVGAWLRVAGGRERASKADGSARMTHRGGAAAPREEGGTSGGSIDSDPGRDG